MSGGGEVHLDAASHRVWCGTAELHLTPKAFDVLSLLIDRRGQLVAKDELMATVWPKVAVSDWALTTSIREIRRALADDPRAPRYLQTVHRLGYRFIGALQAGATSAAAPPPPRAVPTATDLFVGRDAELGELRAWVAEAFAGERRVVFVTGEPGIGKTAIVDALLATIDGAARIGRGQCVDQHGAGEPYLPFLDALGRLARTGAAAAVVDCLARCAPTWLVQMPALVPPSALEALRRRIAGATPERMLREMVEALEALSRECPLALVLEDLHWSDHGTVELLAMLARRREPARLFIIGTCRPVELIMRQHPLHRALQELRSIRLCRELALGYFSELDVAAYLDARFPGGLTGSVAALARLIHRRTHGNPLFVVTMSDFMLRRGAIAIDAGCWRLTAAAEAIADEIPPGLKPTIEKQLEGASPEQLLVLEAACLAGQTFSTATVAAALEIGVEDVEERCAELARRGLCLCPVGPIEWPDATRAEGFEFVHALHVDVLAQRPGAARRQRWHRRIGERLEAAYGDGARAIAAELALHFERGRDPSRAVGYLQQAAENALQRCAPREAVASLTRALQLLDTLPPSAARERRELPLQVALGAALTGTKGYVAPEVEKAYARAWALCRQSEDLSQLLPMAGLYRYAVVRGEHDKGRELAERTLRLAESVGDNTLFMVAHAMLGNILFWLGELATARVHMQRSIGLYDFAQHHLLAYVYGDDPQVASLSFLAWALWLSGLPDQALQRSREALQLAVDLEHPWVHALALNFAAQHDLLRGAGDPAVANATAARELADEHRYTLFSAVATILRGRARVEQGNIAEGIAELQGGLAAYRVIGADSGLPHYFALLAEAHGRAGQPRAALDAVEQGLRIVSKTHERWWEAELHRLRGDMRLAERNGDKRVRRQADTWLRMAIDVARGQQAKMLELRAAMSLAELWRQEGREAQAGAMLETLYTQFDEGFATHDLCHARTLLTALGSGNFS